MLALQVSNHYKLNESQWWCAARDFFVLTALLRLPFKKPSMVRLGVFAALLVGTLVAATEIRFDDGDEKITVLTSFGEADASVSVLYKGPDAVATVSGGGHIVTVADEIIIAPAPGGYKNYSIPLSFTGVGTGEYIVTIGEVSVTGKYCAAGFVIMKDDVIVSGDSGPGVMVGQAPAQSRYKYDVKTVYADGTSADISETTITVTSSMKEVKEMSMSETEFKLVLADYRVGEGSFKILFEADAITYNGEVFETVLMVKQDTEAVPPCVAKGGPIVTSDDGYVIVDMINLGSPPRDSPVGSVEITVGGETVAWDTSKSELSLPDQKVYFKTANSGPASIACDGVDAIVTDDEITVSGPPASAEEPASGLIAGEPESNVLSTFEVTLRVIPYDPDTIGAPRARAIINKVCTVAGSSDCVLTDLVKGSAIMTTKGLVSEDTSDKVKADMEECWTEDPDGNCPCQHDLEYKCGEIELLGAQVNALAGGAAAAGAGLATWTIVLIAVVGAFALILVIVLGLWAVYRRSADQSESDYSSSGPLGVPDPSDLLYEQSIVRDIYGRGDFPEGGPSQAVAEQRAREAEMREEFPRPPSSSGLSRGEGTDDASSTYSV